MNCPLCEIWHKEPENLLYEDPHFVIMRTKNLKGHRERVMLLLKRHVDNLRGLPYDFAWVLDRPEIVYRLKEIFSYTYKIIVMDGKYGSIPEHWHLCITDLEPDSTDHRQILGTPWIKVINVKEWNT